MKRGQICKRRRRCDSIPLSDLSAAKKRPALVVAVLADDDVILCQITSRNVADNLAISLTNSDFTSGGLHQNSNIRPNRIFTADSNIILYRAGVLATAK
ncbi:MAG TPA: type II toxin-antitoxin system PemK/MazF family toxin, partial [Candidatus Binatia bacterium]